MFFITAADTSFFFFLPYQVAQIERLFPEARLILYDLGLEEQEAEQLRDWGVEVKSWHIGLGEPVLIPNYYPRALHKPSILLDALERNPNETAVYLDADAIPYKSFKMPRSFDVAVTMINQDDMAWVDQEEWLEYNGIFNCGVILFGRSKRRLAFVREWMERLDVAGRNESDQRIASLLIEEADGHNRQDYYVTRILKVKDEEVRLRILPSDEWNLFALRCSVLYDKRIPPEEANVLHFKGHSMHLKSDFLNCISMGRMDMMCKEAH